MSTSVNKNIDNRLNEGILHFHTTAWNRLNCRLNVLLPNRNMKSSAGVSSPLRPRIKPFKNMCLSYSTESLLISKKKLHPDLTLLSETRTAYLKKAYI
jgi:hypothetical protein